MWKILADFLCSLNIGLNVTKYISRVIIPFCYLPNCWHADIQKVLHVFLSELNIAK